MSMIAYAHGLIKGFAFPLASGISEGVSIGEVSTIIKRLENSLAKT